MGWSLTNWNMHPFQAAPTLRLACLWPVFPLLLFNIFGAASDCVHFLEFASKIIHASQFSGDGCMGAQNAPCQFFKVKLMGPQTASGTLWNTSDLHHPTGVQA